MRMKLRRGIGMAALLLTAASTQAGGLQLGLDANISSLRGGVINSRFAARFGEGLGATGELLYQSGIFLTGVSTGFHRMNGQDRANINHEKLTFLPVHALVRVQPRLDSKNIGIHFESGLGVTFLRTELSRIDDPERVSYSEAAFSLGGGIGFSQRISDKWAARLSVKIQNVWASEEIDGDKKLQWFFLNLGVRHQLR